MTLDQREKALHRKRFGQYFSGKTVADYLFSLLPIGYAWNTIVDPMAGIGDMLLSVSDHVSRFDKLLGVEIDPEVAARCKARVPNALVKCEDAFACKELLVPDGWDLVITNPPYVRYQLQGNDQEGMPSGKAIRANLIKQLSAIEYLEESEKKLFLSIAQNYSGLADMAVPAWILCAALVKKGGYLAIVVPDTWLNRDYASPIQYLINKCFDIKVIAKDTNANWFPDALVKTCLVVAERTGLRPLIDWCERETTIIEGETARAEKTSSLFPYMLSGNAVYKWISVDDRCLVESGMALPHELIPVVGNQASHELITLQDLGLECGQGLRTGANEFFYLSMVREDSDHYYLRSKAWDQGGKEYTIDKARVLPVLQNRGEIKGLTVKADALKSALLFVNGQVGLDETDLCNYILSADSYVDPRGRRFKDYSAVRPNERFEGNQIVRYWYMLPALANRHVPNLCISRVAAEIPECLFIQQSKGKPIVVDANMVTMWCNSCKMQFALMSILNSTWIKLYLELICTVMGGGALKIEASHLKKVLLPKLSAEQLDDLSVLGKQVVKEGHMTVNIQDQIDGIVFSSFDKTAAEKARVLLLLKYKERSSRK